MQCACLTSLFLSTHVGVVWQKNKLHSFSGCDVNGWVHFGPWGQVSEILKVSLNKNTDCVGLSIHSLGLFIFHCGYCWVGTIQSFGTWLCSVIFNTADMRCRACVSWIQKRVSSTLRGIHTELHQGWQVLILSFPFTHRMGNRSSAILLNKNIVDFWHQSVCLCHSCKWDGNFSAKSVRTVHVYTAFWGGKKHHDDASVFVPWRAKIKPESI